jgi:hypothetical protein
MNLLVSLLVAPRDFYSFKNNSYILMTIFLFFLYFFIFARAPQMGPRLLTVEVHNGTFDRHDTLVAYISTNPFRSYIEPRPRVRFSNSAPTSEDVRHG